jgi:hypothetical protein
MQHVFPSMECAKTQNDVRLRIALRCVVKAG